MITPVILTSRLTLPLKGQWLACARDVALAQPTLRVGSRKILRPAYWTTSLDDTLQLSDVNYTKAKMTALKRYYLHLESQENAIDLWNRRLEMKKYGSVSFTTFNHLRKGGGSHIASIFGPCIQSVCITWLKKDQFAVDVAYRSTEFFKKFPADLVLLRDVLLPPFSLPKDTPVSFYFANVTVHAMYILNIFHLIDDPILFLNKMQKADKVFWKNVLSWLDIYLGGRASKFKQANREAEFFNRANPSKRVAITNYVRTYRHEADA